MNEKDVKGFYICEFLYHIWRYLLLSRSLDDVVVFFLNECLKGPVTDGPHGVVGDSGDEDGEELVLAGLDDKALVVLRAGEDLRHWVLALNTVRLQLGIMFVRNSTGYRVSQDRG